MPKRPRLKSLAANPFAIYFGSGLFLHKMDIILYKTTRFSSFVRFSQLYLEQNTVKFIKIVFYYEQFLYRISAITFASLHFISIWCVGAIAKCMLPIAVALSTSSSVSFATKNVIAENISPVLRITAHRSI